MKSNEELQAENDKLKALLSKLLREERIHPIDRLNPEHDDVWVGVNAAVAEAVKRLKE